MTSVFDIIDMLKRQNGGVAGDVPNEYHSRKRAIPSEDDNALAALSTLLQNVKAPRDSYSWPLHPQTSQGPTVAQRLAALAAASVPGGAVFGTAAAMPRTAAGPVRQPQAVTDYRKRDSDPLANQWGELAKNSEYMQDFAKSAGPLNHGQRERIYDYAKIKSELADAIGYLREMEGQSQSVSDVQAARKVVRNTFVKAREAEALLIAALHPVAPTYPLPGSKYNLDKNIQETKIRELFNPSDYPMPYDDMPRRRFSGVQLENNSGSLLWFYNKVKSGGEWDYKSVFRDRMNQLVKAGKARWDDPKVMKMARDVENFGNWHFGHMAATMGIPLETAQQEAGFAQRVDNHVRDDDDRLFTPSFGKAIRYKYLPMGGEAPYGDDYTDNYWIRRGYNDYMAKNPRVKMR